MEPSTKTDKKSEEAEVIHKCNVEKFGVNGAAAGKLAAGHFLILGLWFLGCGIPEPAVLPCIEDGRLGDCCSQGHPCGEGLTCNSVADVPVCTTLCDLAAKSCPEDSECVFVDDESHCLIAGGKVGDRCNPDDGNGCRPGLVCIGADGFGVCTTACDPDNLCPPKALVGNRVCVVLTDDVGTYCLRPCSTDDDCAEGTACTPVSDTLWRVCFLP